MDNHKRTLGILFISYAAVKVALYFFAMQIISMAIDFTMEEKEILFATYIAKYVIGSIILLYAVPSIIAGVGLLSGKRWALILALILGIISLPVFPLGTGLGVYAIIVFLMDHSKTYNPGEQTDEAVTATE